MELKIIEKKENKLLSRTEITAEMVHEGPTPSYDAIKKALAKQVNADESLIAVKHVYPSYGESRVKIIANIYDDKKAMESIEPAAPKKEEKPAEKKEEKPAEKKEEKPAEEKPAEEKSAEKKEEKPAEKKEGEK